MIHSIYCIRNTLNNKVYIGISCDVKSRWRNHRNRNDKGVKRKVLYSAFDKHGIDEFTFEVIYETLDREHACAMEIFFIKEYNSLVPCGYNVSKGGRGGNNRTGSKLDDEIRQRISRSVKAAYTPAHRQAVSVRKKGTKWTPEQHEKRIKRDLEGKCWMTRGKTTKQFRRKEVETMIAQGWVSGRRSATPVLRAVKVNGVFYNTVTEAAESLGLLPQTLNYYLRGRSSVPKLLKNGVYLFEAHYLLGINQRTFVLEDV